MFISIGPTSAANCSVTLKLQCNPSLILHSCYYIGLLSLGFGVCYNALKIWTYSAGTYTAIILILVLIIGITIFTLDFNFGETGHN